MFGGLDADLFGVEALFAVASNAFALLFARDNAADEGGRNPGGEATQVDGAILQAGSDHGQTT